MFFAEMKKIWRPGIFVLIILISVLWFSTFMLRCIKPFQFKSESDSTQIMLELCSNFIEKYGNTIESEEFVEIEHEYKQLLYGANTMIAETNLFVQNGVENYEDYFQYMQNAIQGADGYDYNTYAEMRELIIRATGKSAIYFEVYEDIIQQYKSADIGRNSMMPYEILAYANDYFVSMIIWCLICTFLIATPVMVNDRASDMIANQYSSKVGKKIHRIQCFCMNLSVLIMVSIIVITALFGWKTTGTLQYADSGIASFLNSETPVFLVTYEKFMLSIVAITYVLTLGVANIVFYLSAKSENVIHMLIKAIPVFIVGCLVGLFMNGLFCESNRLYKMFHIPGCEMMVVFAIFVVGVFLNVRNYRAMQKCDY